MATGGCDRQNLLAIFPDNTTQEITPADLRQLVNCIYDNFLDIVYVVDNLNTYEPKQALSANQGAVLNDMIENNTQDILDMQVNKANAADVYTKVDIDTNHYNKAQIDAGFYTKTDTYNQQEIDNMFYTLQQQLEYMNNKIDEIVTKNNLIPPTQYP